MFTMVNSKCIVTFVDSPDCFFVRDAESEENLQTVNKIIEEVFFNQEIPEFSQELLDGIYLTRNPASDQVFRSWITEIWEDAEDGPVIATENIDFGNTTVVPFNGNNVRKMPKELGGCPPLAQECRLNKIFPASGKWREKAMEEFRKLVKNVQCTREVVSEFGSIQTIDLYCNPNVFTGSPISVRDHLLHIGVAVLGVARNTRTINLEPEPQFREPRFLKAGVSCFVRMSYVEQGDCIWVQPASLIGKDGSRMSRMFRRLEARFSQKSKLMDVQQGDVIMVKSRSDSRIYRGEVTKRPIGSQIAEVRFVDTGRIEMCAPEQMRSIDKEMINKSTKMAVPVRLHGVAPTDPHFGFDTAEEFKRYLQDNVDSGESFLMHVAELQDSGHLSVFLVDKDNQCVNGRLIGLGLVGRESERMCHSEELAKALNCDRSA